jgi:TonB-linked SusC/RagA family outer membrane protein
MKNTSFSLRMKTLLLVGGVCLPMVRLQEAKAAANPEESTAKAKETQTANVVVRGVVRDAATRETMPGVAVFPYGDKKHSAMTGEDGSYTLNCPRGTAMLVFECVGYNRMQQPVGAVTDSVQTVDAALYTSNFSADYAARESSAQSVAAVIDNRTADISVDDQIGASLGGQIRSILRSGAPGVGAYMLLGGINSLNANAQPLIVLDGVIMDMQYGRSSIHDGFFNNILANVSVEDIDKVTVLRNGTALYGAKGANGVILIDTKRSSSMATQIDVSIAGRYETLPTLPDMMNASGYRGYVSELLGTTGTKMTEFKFLREEPDYYYYKMYHNNTDWSDLVYDEAFTQNYSINVQGGDDVAKYNLSVGYAQADATLKNNDFSRFNLRLNSDVRLSDRLNVRLDASYSDVNRDLRDDGIAADVSDRTITSPGFLSLVKAPFLNPYAFDTQGNISSFLADADDYLNEVLDSEASLANPLSLLRNGEADNKNSFGNRLISLGIAPEYQFNKGFKLSEHFSFLMLNTDENYYLPLTGVPRFEVGEMGWVNNMVSAMSSHQYLTTSDTRLEWEQRFGLSDVHLTGGFRYNLSNYALNSMQGYNSGNDKSPNMSSSLSYKTTAGESEKITTLTYYLLGDYNYAGKYFFSAGTSMEASSRFGSDVSDGFKMAGVVWGLFPSVNAAWIMSNEPWFRRNRWVNYLKLNVGFDKTGNDDIDVSASRTYFQASLLLNALDGVTVGNIGNTSLQWETTRRLSAGVDATFFDQRLSLSGHYFKSWTSDLLSEEDIAYVTGLDQSWCNVGALENQGFDLTLNVKALNRRNWKLEVGASVGHYKNEVTELPNSGRSLTTTLYGATVLTQIGSPVGLFYGYKTDGVYSTTEEARADGYYQVTETGTRQYFSAGDVRFVNASDDSKEINDKDRVVIGDPNPDLYGNIYAHLKYKQWGLNMAFNYCLGNDVFNYQRSILEGGNYFYNQTTAMQRRWTGEGQVTDIPKITYEDPMGNARFSDRWIEDGSYMRLKNVTLSYDWNIGANYIQGITFWVAANNLFTLTKYLGSDPESSAGNSVLCQGIDRGLLASGRSFSLGLKINL